MSEPDVYEILLSQGVPPAVARERADQAARLRTENAPGPPLDLKKVYAASATRDPSPDPGPGERPPGFNQAIYDGLVEKGYRNEFAEEVASRGYTFEHSVDLAEKDAFLRSLYKGKR